MRDEVEPLALIERVADRFLARRPFQELSAQLGQAIAQRPDTPVLPGSTVSLNRFVRTSGVSSSRRADRSDSMSASSYFMKSPPVQYPDDQARDNVEKFIAGEIDF